MSSSSTVHAAGGGGHNAVAAAATAVSDAAKKANAAPSLGVSASVGHDHWANDVLSAVSEDRDAKQNAECNGGTATPSVPAVAATVSAAPPKVDAVAEKILQKKRQFHSGRVLELKNLPDGCTEQDIRASFSDLSILSVTIERNDGRYKAGAKLTLEQPEVLDEWPQSRQNVYVKNKEVSVCVGSSDGWLCVAKLPLDFTDEMFTHLAGSYGRVKEAFLMVSPKTGSSKGYGLIKYYSSDAAAQARHLLDGRLVGQSYQIECDWLNSSHISFASLHSKALFVNCLPPNYRHLDDFKKLFSKVERPGYCQIAILKGVIQDWGLVEFYDPMISESTQRELNGHSIRGYNIRVHFCIPGVNAINIYMQAVNAPPDTKKKALLNDTPSANVYSQLQKLATQNPNFAQNLQSIIQDQISSLSSGRSLLSDVSTSCASSTAASTSSSSSTVSTTTSSASSVPQFPTMLAATPSLTNNAQAALMILLTAQMQSQTGQGTDLLQNPQVVGVLQNLVDPASPGAVDASLNDLLSNPTLGPVFGQTLPALGKVTSVPPAPSDTNKENRTVRPTLINDAPQNGKDIPKDASPTPPIVANNLNNLLNAQNLNELLGSLSSAPVSSSTIKDPIVSAPPPSLHTSRPPPLVARRHNMAQRPVLLGDGPPPSSRPPVTSIGQRHSIPPPPLPAGYGSLPGGIPGAPASANPYLFPGLSLTGPPPAPSFYLGASAAAYPPTSLANAVTLNAYAAQHQAAQQQQQQQLAAAQQQLVNSQYGLFSAASNQMAAAAAAAASVGYPTGLTQAATGYSLQAAQSAYDPNAYFAQQQQAAAAVVAAAPAMAPVGTPYGVPSAAAAPSTPIGSKRKLAIPPAPEQSPEGRYIGQHSQGIGGHYADSYWSRKRTKFD